MRIKHMHMYKAVLIFCLRTEKQSHLMGKAAKEHLVMMCRVTEDHNLV